MAAFVFSLSYSDSANWPICKDTGLIGVRSSASAQRSALQVHQDDIVFVWRGGGQRPGAGLIAMTTVTGPARPARNVPWPEPELYSYVIPIKVVAELATPIPDQFPNNQRGIKFGIQNTDLQKGLRPLSQDSFSRLRQCFS